MPKTRGAPIVRVPIFIFTDNRFGMFDRRSLKRPISKKRSLADAVKGLERHAAAQSQSLSGGWNNYNAEGEVQFIFIH